MEGFVYCIENSWLTTEGSCRNVYVRFNKKLSEINIESLKNILCEKRIQSSVRPEDTHYDIVYDSLMEFYTRWEIEGKIIDGVQHTIIY